MLVFWCYMEVNYEVPHPLYAWGKAKITHGAAGWVVPIASLTLCREKNVLPHPGDESQLFGWPAHSLFATPINF
jgi:hypothetical protein